MILHLGSHLQAGQEPEMSYGYTLGVENSNGDVLWSETVNIPKTMEYHPHVQWINSYFTGAIVSFCHCHVWLRIVEMNWIGHPGLLKGTLSLVGLNDGFVLTTSFCQQDSKGSSKNWWLSQQLVHPLMDRMGFSHFSPPRGSCFLMELDPSWSISLGAARGCLKLMCHCLLHGASGSTTWRYLEKKECSIPFNSDSNLIFSIINQSSLLKPYQVCKLETINIPMHIMHVGCSKPLIQCCHLHHE